MTNPPPPKKRFCTCSDATPIGLMTTRYNCDFHKYLRTGEAIYMVKGERPKFAVIKNSVATLELLPLV